MGKTTKTDMLKVRITPDLKAKIQAAAEAENRTVSGYIVNLIMRDIAKKQISSCHINLILLKFKQAKKGEQKP